MKDYDVEIPKMIDEIKVILNKYDFEIEDIYISGQGKLFKELRGHIYLQVKENNENETDNFR